MLEFLRQRQMLQKGGVLAQPLNFNIHGSDSVGFSISPYAYPPNGKITAIRVQDISRNIWFNYDNGVWDKVPSCVPGAGNLYIAFWAVNRGTGPGTLYLGLSDDQAKLLAGKQEYANVGAGVGVEWTGTMPNRSYGIGCSVDP